MTSSPTTPVYLEAGAKRVFACALDWPGWCRAGKSEEQALEALAAYLPRYALVAKRAGLALPPGAPDTFEVTERLASTGGYADFGVPGAVTAGDRRPLDAAEAGRLIALLQAAWATFDHTVGGAPAELRRGPRGGGRDRDRIVEHVLAAEAAYGRKVGVRFRQPAVGDTSAIAAARSAVVAALGQPSDGGPLAPNGWPVRYAVRRFAWHVLDHAWEVEDRSSP